jgi:hypothetical protein
LNGIELKMLRLVSSLLLLSGVTSAGITPCAEADCPGGACAYENCENELSCRGGACLFTNCKQMSCRGGACLFHSSHAAKCVGGACHYILPKHDFDQDEHCPGGGCSLDETGETKGERAHAKTKVYHAKLGEYRARHKTDEGQRRAAAEAEKSAPKQDEPEPAAEEEQDGRQQQHQQQHHHDDAEEDEEPEADAEDLEAARDAARKAVEENPIPEDTHVSDEL